ncbi:cyclophilin-like domain-containing protein [Lineolata rhizophorae]|uniref:Cyclophilin-like domain-containing protein n=1 Tax=Lineolata rhizophorae TaxID=578093 RepID=A0A6A6P0W3_9PEZI|nr:cyclophilin-like domain-containing protein [Lineolata rhizophorae]
MSSMYNLEPPPTAKVVLHTTSGDISLELFGKQTPLATRNFLQHCLDGYYTNTVFHRLVPGFILQGGDPTGTGAGGVSVYNGGEPFKDEFHSRLKFNRRGQLGLANTGRKDDNGSQFFITLGSTPELQGKNTLFGRVEGDTIYNVAKMGEAELAEEGGDRPLYPTRITGAEILVNPFEDMVKKEEVKPSKGEEKPAKKKQKKKGGKALLSFGADEEGDEGDLAVPVVKKPKFNPLLVAGGEKKDSEHSLAASRAPESKTAPKPVEKPSRRQPSLSRSPSPAAPPRKSTKLPLPTTSSKRRSPSRSRSPSSSSDSSSFSVSERKPSRLDRTNAQIAELMASMRRDAGLPRNEVTSQKKQPSARDAWTPKNSKPARKRGKAQTAAEEAESLAKLDAFRRKLVAAQAAREKPTGKDKMDVEGREAGKKKEETEKAAAEDLDEDDPDAKLCDLHFIANCQSCSAWDEAEKEGQDEDEDDMSWLAHKLSFAKDRLGKDLEWKRKNEEELVVYDPREREKEFKRAKKG